MCVKEMWHVCHFESFARCVLKTVLKVIHCYTKTRLTNTNWLSYLGMRIRTDGTAIPIVIEPHFLIRLRFTMYRNPERTVLKFLKPKTEKIPLLSSACTKLPQISSNFKFKIHGERDQEAHWFWSGVDPLYRKCAQCRIHWIAEEVYNILCFSIDVVWS